MYRVASVRLIGRNVGDIVSGDDYTAGEIDFMLKAGLLEPTETPKKPRRSARKDTTDLTEDI
jgi:hypothetical protein